jgi:peptidoglycan DL-endopeptidase CwlO
MSTNSITRSQRPRRVVVGAALVLGTLSSTAFAVAPVAAAPLRSSSAVEARSRALDPLADQAVAAAALLARHESGDTSVWDAYVDARDAIAVEAAARAGVDAGRMVEAWAETDVVHQRALLAAFTQIGVPYRRNSSRPGIGFDCSGLTTFAWGQVGITLPRSSGSQIRSVAPRTADTAMAGDLVQYPGHVMMWLGVDNAIIHSPQSGRTVSVDTVSTRRKLRYGDPTG